MAKRLHMTTADYVAIAISPALVMALVGSLVFFLIEVFYVGQHPARLNYVFAWFVFAAVLVARIAIEMGSERAFLFALPLGVITFVAMVRFVEQPGPFGQLINVALLGVVWWSAHKLTWDCTLIDDDEDASGVGLMQRLKGLKGDGALLSRRLRSTADVPEPGREKRAPSPFKGQSREIETPTPSSADNELPDEFDDALPDNAPGWRYRSRKRNKKRRPHAPGLWVLYFSLAALPLFGMGQRWIPASDVGSRRYAFFLLVVYVAAALALLVTTSFLGLRRYLRQRRVEMPAPMAATWMGVGGALIVATMVLVALIPRPAAEVAISQAPWQIGSRDRIWRSRTGVNIDDVEGRNEPASATDADAKSPAAAAQDDRDRSAEPANGAGGDAEPSAQDDRGSAASRSSAADNPSSRIPGDEKTSSQQQQQGPRETAAREADAAELESGRPISSEGLRAFETVQTMPWSTIVDLLKWIFYFVVGLLILIFVWRNFAEIANSLLELVRQLGELLARLFGGGRATAAGDGRDGMAVQVDLPPPKFRDFQNPFATGTHEQLPPHELVRYTFEAFEAWARDSGHARTPDQTPHELVRIAIAPQAPMYAQARRMAELYGETAYGIGAVSRESANSLKRIWAMMHETSQQQN